MAIDLDVVRMAERAPLRTIGVRDLVATISHPRVVVARLGERGVLTRLARGVYCLPPEGRDGRRWKPGLEVGALAVATVRFGNRVPILMGIGAARYWQAIPRAVGATTVAVPEGQVRRPVDLATGGTVHLIPRDLQRIEAELVPTELGSALVTTPAQTLYDLLMKPKQGGMPGLALDAAQNLLARVERADLQALVREIGRANDRVRGAVGDGLAA